MPPKRQRRGDGSQPFMPYDTVRRERPRRVGDSPARGIPRPKRYPQPDQETKQDKPQRSPGRAQSAER